MKGKAIPDSVVEAFERLRAAYPHRPDNPRAPALAVFAKLVENGEDPEALVLAAAAYASAWRARASRLQLDAQFIPHTRTWLSQRRFDDYMPKDPPASAADARPSPEHPLRWLVRDLGEDAWASWIAPLRVEVDDINEARIVAETSFALKHVRRNWGAKISAAYDRVDWEVAS